MSGLRITSCLLVLLLGAPLHARTWTDKSGRAIEAIIMSADETHVVIDKDGKEFKLPLANLSEADQAYVKEWLKEEQQRAEERAKEKADEKKAEENKVGENKPAAPVGGLTFDGKPLELGGKTNLFEYPYTPEQLEDAKKFKAGDTGYKVALALPANFDPTKPQKVFIVCTAENNAAQSTAGNVGMMSFFGKQCAMNGWVCMAYDTNLGRKNHFMDLYAALLKIQSQWPQFKQWSFATGGFSGGAKACMYPMGYLLKNEYKVIGGFLAGCNEDRSGEAQDIFKVPKAAYKDVRIFLGNPTYKAEYAPPVQASMKRNGISNVRAEVHNGKNSLEYGQFAIGLKWIAGEG